MVDISLLSRSLLSACLEATAAMDAPGPGCVFLSPGSRLAIQAFPDAEQTGSHLFCQRRAVPARTKADTVIVKGDGNILASFLPGMKLFFHRCPISHS
jgi:hypothetical protein